MNPSGSDVAFTLIQTNPYYRQVKFDFLRPYVTGARLRGSSKDIARGSEERKKRKGGSYSGERQIETRKGHCT